MPYHKAKILYLTNLERNSFRIAGALKSHFFAFSALTNIVVGHNAEIQYIGANLMRINEQLIQSR